MTYALIHFIDWPLMLILAYYAIVRSVRKYEKNTRHNGVLKKEKAGDY